MSKIYTILKEWSSSDLFSDEKLCKYLGINKKTLSVKVEFKNDTITLELIVSGDETLKDLKKIINKLLSNKLNELKELKESSPVYKKYNFIYDECDIKVNKIFFENETSIYELTSLDQIKNNDTLVVYLRDTYISKIISVSVEFAGSGKIITHNFSFNPNISFCYDILYGIDDLLPHKSLPYDKYYDLKNHKIFLGHGGPELTNENILEIKNGDTLVILPATRSHSLFFDESIQFPDFIQDRCLQLTFGHAFDQPVDLSKWLTFNPLVEEPVDLSKGLTFNPPVEKPVEIPRGLTFKSSFNQLIELPKWLTFAYPFNQPNQFPKGLTFKFLFNQLFEFSKGFTIGSSAIVILSNGNIVHQDCNIEYSDGTKVYQDSIMIKPDRTIVLFKSDNSNNFNKPIEIPKGLENLIIKNSRY